MSLSLRRRRASSTTDAATATVDITTDTTNEARTSTNVWADTPGGDPNNVIVVGSHLDSVEAGPGINDNGTGSSFNLEAAVQMAKLRITPTKKVRFAFWGAEEAGLIGSTYYVDTLPEAELAKIKGNLNFDMLGSPNIAKFVYDGDFSDTDSGGLPVNAGAAEIERLLRRLLQLGRRPDGADGLRRPVGLRGVPARRHPGGRPVLRGRGHQVGRPGRQVGRDGRPAVRPVLPRGVRHAAERRLRRLRAAGRRRRARARHARHAPGQPGRRRRGAPVPVDRAQALAVPGLAPAPLARARTRRTERGAAGVPPLVL